MSYRHMSQEDFQRLRALERLTGFPQFWIAQYYFRVIDAHPDKTDEEIADILMLIECNPQVQQMLADGQVNEEAWKELQSLTD